MATPRSAPSAFNGSPLDNLAAVDVYGQTASDVRNNFVSTVSAFGESLASSLGQQRQLLSDLTTLATGTAQDIEQAKSRLNNVLRGARSQLSGLGDQLQEQLYSALGVNDASALRVEVNGILRQIQGGDYNNAQGITALLQDVLGSNNMFSVIDAEAQANVLGTALGEVSKWGVPDALDIVMANMSDEGIKRRAFKQAAQGVVEQSDIDSLATLVKDQTALQAMREQYPAFATQVLQRYQFPREHNTPDRYPERIEQLVQVMDRIQPDWFYTQRGREQVINLAVLNKASEDAVTLLTSAEPYRSAILVAQHYDSRNNSALLTQFYPYIPILVG